MARVPVSTTLREIRMMIEAEIIAQPATVSIALNRTHVVVVEASLAEVEDRVAVLEEIAVGADRLAAELKIAEAEIERLRLQVIARDLLAARVPIRSVRPLGGNVVDLGEALRRERREAGRPVPPEGGAA